MPRSRPRRLLISADIEVEAARESTTHSSICTTMQITATGSRDHGTLRATAMPSSAIMFATGR